MSMTYKGYQVQLMAECLVISSSNEQFYYDQITYPCKPTHISALNPLHPNQNIRKSAIKDAFLIRQLIKLLFYPNPLCILSNCFIFNIRLVQMDKSPKVRPKKNYFTKSQALLPSTHPTQEFLSIIQLKKHYQSLIKQQLDALGSIQNVQTQELNKWQQQIEKQVKVSFFEAKEADELKKDQQLSKVQKSSQQFISCYEQLRLIKMQKCFIRMKSRLACLRENGVKKRAASYFRGQNISQKWFELWKSETRQAINQVKIVKDKQQMLFSQLKRLQFLNLIYQMNFSIKKRIIKPLFGLSSKKMFFKSFCMLASFKFQKMQEKRAIEELRKRQGCRILKRHLGHRKKTNEVQMKTKLLRNICYHRKFNIFFNACKRKVFKNQQQKITQQIIDKIDLFQLISSTSELSSKREHFQKEETPANYSKQKETTNIQLLNLILENFVEEYSQEYSTSFNEQQRLFLLQQLKAQCLSQLILKQKIGHFLKNLLFCSRRKKIAKNYQICAISSFYKRLYLYSHIKNSFLDLTALIKLPKATYFLSVARKNKDIASKIELFNQRKVNWKFQARKMLKLFRQNLSQKKAQKFHNDIASNWRKIQVYKKFFDYWLIFKQQLRKKANFMEISIKEDVKQSKNELQGQNWQQSVNTHQQLPVSGFQSQNQEKLQTQHKQDQGPQQTERVTKAKIQLSKIVSVISKKMGSKYSFDSYSKSIQSQDSNKFPLLRLKTESAQKDQENDYEPRIFQLELLSKKENLEEQMLKQIQRRTKQLISKLREFRLLSTLRNIKKQRQFSFKRKKLLKVYLSKFIQSLKQKSKANKQQKLKTFQLILWRKHKGLSQYLFHSQLCKKLKENVLSLKEKTKKEKKLQFLKKIVSKRIFLQKKQNLNLFFSKSFSNIVSKFFYKAYKISLIRRQQKQIASKIIVNRKTQFKKHFCSQLIYLSRKKRLRLFIFKRNCQKFKNKLLEYKEMLNKKKKKSNFLQKNLKQEENFAKYLEATPSKQKFVFQFEFSQNLFQNTQTFKDPQLWSKSSIRKDTQMNKQLERPEQVSKHSSNKALRQSVQKHINNIYEESLKKEEESQSDSQQEISQQQKKLLELIKQEKNSFHQQNMLISSLEKGQICEDQDSPSKYKETNRNETKPQLASSQEDQNWLQQQIKAKRLKKFLFQQKCSYFLHQLHRKIPKKEEKIEKKEEQIEKSLDDSISQTNQLYKACRTLFRRKFLLLLLEKHRKKEQELIKKQEQLEIVKYQLFKRQKQLKKKIFISLSSQVQLKKGLDLKRRCFRGLLLFSRQKKALKEYLNLQARSKEEGLSFFPGSLQQKQKFNDLKLQ